MGPMNAARSFVELLAARGLLERTAQVSAQLYGSLALTGRGHCTDRAMLLGPRGLEPRHASTPRSIEADVEADPHRADAFACWAGTRSPSTSRSICCSTSIRCCRGIPTACASPRTTRRSKCWRARSTTASAAASSCRRAPRRRPANARAQAALRVRLRRATARARAPGGPGNPRADAGARAHLVRRCRDSRAADAHLAGDAGLRAPRLRGARAAARRARGAPPRAASCIGN